MKKFLSFVLALVMLVSLLAGCGAKQGTKGGDAVKIDSYKEAPMLAEMVANGELPALEDRIPGVDDVYVDTEFQDHSPKEIGTYGGVMRVANVGSKVGNWMVRNLSIERPIDFYTDGTTFPNVLKSLEPNEDYTVWTMKLREGMRWSDGEPFTSDDVVFWYYMMHKNDYYGRANSVAACFQMIDGEKVWADVAPVDDYTVTWTFAEPQYGPNFAETGSMKWVWYPAHFWKDKIPSSYYIENPYYEDTGLSDEEVLAKFLELGMEFDNVKSAGKSAYYHWQWYQFPTLYAYVLTDEEGFNKMDDPIVKYVRNPYYWKVDAEGNQLPYIDEIDFINVNDKDQAILMLESGEVDYVKTDIKDVVAIQDAMGDNVQTKMLTPTSWGANQLCFNLSIEDPEMHELLNNVSFRRALSVAVDRNEVVNLWYDGLTDPTNCAPAEGTWGYNEEWSYRYTEYNPDQAKEMLANDCGLTLGDDGWFYFPSGNKVSLTVIDGDTSSEKAEQWAVLQPYFDAIGIEMIYFPTGEAGTLQDSNEGWQAAFEAEDMLNGYKIDARPKQFVPLGHQACWYSMYDVYGKDTGEQYYAPEGAVKELCDAYLEWMATPTTEEREPLEKKMMQIHMDNMWVIAYSSCPAEYYMVSSKVQNWPDEMPNEDKFNYQNQFHFYTMFFAE